MSEKSHRRVTVLTGFVVAGALVAIAAQFVYSAQSRAGDRAVITNLSHACADLQARNIALQERVAILEVELHPELAETMAIRYQY